METYRNSLTAVPAPLIIIQGVSDELRPKISNRRVKTLKEQAFVPSEKKHNYGVQIAIDRELDDLNNNCIERLVGLVDKCNVRDRIWWPNQDGNASLQQSQSAAGKNLEKSPMKQKQQAQLTRQRMLTTLSSGSSNSKGLWFNIKYVDRNYELIVNGSKSPLSPYNKDGEFFGSLLPLEWSEKYYDYIPSVFITFYEIGNDKTFDDVLINEINRVKLKFSNTMIKFVCVLIDTNKTPITSDRLQNLITRINMNTNSLFVINGSTDEISRREQTVFIRKLMIGLRQYSNDFFNLQIQKLKRREIKDDQYSEKFFSARNLIKMAAFEQFKGITDYSAKLLEYAYDRLLQSLRSIDPINQSPQHKEVRNWLDIMCMHIVRSCIVLGDANVAFRKFTFHVQQIRELDGTNFTFDWLANQYTWLAELVENINECIVPIDSVLMPTLGLKEIRYNSYNMPQNGFNYLQAAEYRSLSIQYEDTKSDNTIMLLTAALDSFNLAKSGKFSRIESRVYILLGDVYYAKKNYSMAVNNYFAGLSNYKQESCRFIVGNIFEKVLDCYIGLSQIREAWGVYIELCSIDDYVWEKAGVLESTKEILDTFKEKIISLDLIGDSESIILDEGVVTAKDKVMDENSVSFVKEGVFDVNVDIKEYTNMMNEGVDIQFLIKHRGDKMISGLEINALDIELGENCEFKVIRVVNNSSGVEKNGPVVVYPLECVSKDNKEQVECPLEFKTIDGSKDVKLLVLQLHVISSVVGKFYAPRVKINGTLNDVEFNTVINIAGLDNVSRPFIKWYSTEKGVKPEILNNHYPSNSFEVLPKIPEIKCKLQYDRVGFNGRKFPVLLKFFNNDPDSTVKIHVKGIAQLVKKYEIVCKWGERFKDDTYTGKDVLNPGENVEIECVLDLPQVNGLPLNVIDGDGNEEVEEGTNCSIKFDIQYELVSDGVSIDAKKEGKIKIVEMIEWHTELRADKGGDFPNLFEIDESKMFKVSSTMNIPIHTRKWMFTLNLKNISFEDMNITSCKFVIRGPKGVSLTLTPLLKEDEENVTKLVSMSSRELRVLLEVVCYERIVKSVPVDIHCIMEYYIDQMKDDLQKYKLEMYKANLPHVDPRMLVVIDEGEVDDEYTINYIIENPTDRIFQYQTNLNPVKGVEIVDYVKSMQLSVMPFMRETFDFKYKVKELGDGDIMLPEFTLYDRQYQVFVKPNVADDKLRLIDGHLFLKR